MVGIGARVERAGEAFPFGVRDTVWLAECDERGWVALTRDRNIRRRALERRAIHESGVAVFVFIGGEATARPDIVSICLRAQGGGAVFAD